jgi:hypothetical protein
MVIYNITTLVDPSILEPWLTWMREGYIPEVMKTGCFLRYQFVRLLDVDESHGLTYATQLYAKDRDACDHFSQAFEPGLEREGWRLWGDKRLSYRTLMEVVH